MNKYIIDFYGRESDIDAETAGKAKYKFWRDLYNSDFDISFENFLKMCSIRLFQKNIRPAQTIYSFRDSENRLCVDCFECKRGFNGEKDCSAGWNHESGGRGSCFCGELLEGIVV